MSEDNLSHLSDEHLLLTQAKALPEFWMVYGPPMENRQAPHLFFASDSVGAKDKAKALAEEHPGRRYFCLFCSGGFIEAYVRAEEIAGSVDAKNGNNFAMLLARQGEPGP